MVENKWKHYFLLGLYLYITQSQLVTEHLAYWHLALQGLSSLRGDIPEVNMRSFVNPCNI